MLKRRTQAITQGPVQVESETGKGSQNTLSWDYMQSFIPGLAWLKSNIQTAFPAVKYCFLYPCMLNSQQCGCAWLCQDVRIHKYARSAQTIPDLCISKRFTDQALLQESHLNKLGTPLPGACDSVALNSHLHVRALKWNLSHGLIENVSEQLANFFISTNTIQASGGVCSLILKCNAFKSAHCL